MLWSGLLLALVASVDGLVVGVSYGMRRIALPFASLVIVALCTAGGMAVSMLFGDAMLSFVPERAAELLAGLVIIAFGVWQGLAGFLHQVRQRAMLLGEGLGPLVRLRIRSLGVHVQVLVDPVQADADRSGVIDPKEAVALGVALGLDTLAVGFAAGVAGLGAWIIGGVALALAVLMWVGVHVGRSAGRGASSPWWYYAPALLLIALGLSHL